MTPILQISCKYLVIERPPECLHVLKQEIYGVLTFIYHIATRFP